eukprot:CAMPEP_0181537150 /NCGR_PEP_ID=MMETSP1110-20121109/75198_1 /TAXON_ID=174948 /ORGANISM="Symbiodinium sp., Strain CCMP421" /LENGTH=158 /DNA_ID=CAMNT_0023668703 /DNA_START=301 /DNA_END=778 /DNA_ORIENTATION=-
MQQREDGALPKGVAGIHQLVGPALKAALVVHLLVHRPLQEAVQVQSVGLACNAKCREAAVGVSSMCLKALLSGNATLPGLAPADVLWHTLQQLIGEHVQHGGCGDRAVASSHVRLALIMHFEASIWALHPHQKAVMALRSTTLYAASVPATTRADTAA